MEGDLTMVPCNLIHVKVCESLGGRNTPGLGSVGEVYQWSGLGEKTSDLKLGPILVLAIGSACMQLGYCIYAGIFCGEGLEFP